MFDFLKKAGKEPENLREILTHFKDLQDEFKKISEELDNLKKKHNFSLQKVGVVRFNPFSGVGSDQSFSIALLDATNSGVIITSLYTREENRVYGKPIDQGQSTYVLSEEEKEAVQKAINGKNNNENSSKKNKSSRKRGSSASGSGGFGSH